MNTKRILIHVAWLSVAVATFVFGRLSAPKPDIQPGVSRDNVVGKSGTAGTNAKRIADEENAAKSKLDSEATDDTESVLTATPELKINSRQEFSDSLRKALQEPDLLKRKLLIAQLLRNLTPENAPEALEMIRATSSIDEMTENFKLLGFAWGAVDASGALAAIEEMGGPMSFRMVGSVISGWATSDPEDAIAWVAQLEDGRQKQTYTVSLVESLAGTDPAAATEFVLSNLDSENAAKHIRTVAQAQSREGVASAITWAESLPEGDIRNAALQSVALQYARQDPEGALNWALQSASDGAGKESIASAVNAWARQDPNATSKYLNTLKASPERDAAVSAFAQNAVREDPQSALAWAGTIEDNAARIDTLTAVAQRWKRLEPDAVAEWLPSSGLPAEAQEKVLNPGPAEGGGSPGGGRPGGIRPGGGPGGGGPGGLRGGGRGFGGGGPGGRRPPQ